MVKLVELVGVEEVPISKMRVLSVGTLEVLVANVDGTYYAVENRCPHIQYPLHFGSIEGKILTCSFHGAKFDIFPQETF